MEGLTGKANDSQLSTQILDRADVGNGTQIHHDATASGPNVTLMSAAFPNHNSSFSTAASGREQMFLGESDIPTLHIQPRDIFKTIVENLSHVGYHLDMDERLQSSFLGSSNQQSFPHNITTWDFDDWGGNLSNLSYGFNQTYNDEGVIFLPGAVLSGIFLALVILMTIIGNILVLVAVAVNPHLRGTTHYFIANLAVADLLLGTTVLPFSASLEIINYWAFGQLFCNIWAAMDVLCCTASIMNLCVISIDRYIGVTRPLQHSTIMSERRSLYIIILVWILSLCISVAPLFGWKEPPPDDPTICEITKQLGYVLFSVSGSFYIPLMIILIVYFRVYREALSQSRFLSTGVKRSKSGSQNAVTLRIHTGGGGLSPNPSTKHMAYGRSSAASSEHSLSELDCRRQGYPKLTMAGKIAKFKREKKAAKTLGIVVGVFILCWFPFFFLLPLEALCTTCYIPGWLFKVAFWLGYCNSMMNPIIYACSSREFKRAFIRILRCRFRRSSRPYLSRGTGSFLSSSGRTDITKLTKINHTIRYLAKRTAGGASAGKNRNKRNKSSDKRVSGNGGKRIDDGANCGLLWAEQGRCLRLASEEDRLLWGRDLGNGKTGTESPIIPLKQLHDKQRLGGSIVISDDESAIHEISDDEDVEDGCKDVDNISIGRSIEEELSQHRHKYDLGARNGLPLVINVKSSSTNRPMSEPKTPTNRSSSNTCNTHKVAHSVSLNTGMNKVLPDKLSTFALEGTIISEKNLSQNEPTIIEKPCTSTTSDSSSLPKSSKSEYQCNGIPSFVNVEEANKGNVHQQTKGPNRYHAPHDDGECHILQLPNDMESQALESDRLIFEVTDDSIMWL